MSATYESYAENYLNTIDKVAASLPEARSQIRAARNKMRGHSRDSVFLGQIEEAELLIDHAELLLEEMRGNEQERENYLRDLHSTRRPLRNWMRACHREGIERAERLNLELIEDLHEGIKAIFSCIRQAETRTAEVLLETRKARARRKIEAAAAKKKAEEDLQRGLSGTLEEQLAAVLPLLEVE